MSGDIKLGNSLEQLTWNSITENFDLNLIIPDLSYGDTLSLEIVDFKFDTNFQVDWTIGYTSGGAISWLFRAGNEYLIASWPDFNQNLTSSEDSNNLKSWDAGNNAWISNLFILILHDTGIVGMAVFLAFLWAVYRDIRQVLSDNHDTEYSIHLIGFAGGAFALLVAYQATSAFSMGFTWIVTAMIGLACTFHREEISNRAK